jgi:uncharacterized Zn finger protein
MFREWKPYVPAAERRKQASREMQKLAKKGHAVSPVTIEGRAIAKTFWGKAWCDNLERYRDYDNRLPRGRSYVRSGAVVDLQINKGEINAKVSGSQIYKVEVSIATLPAARWKSLVTDCAGEIDSLVELLQGTFSEAVMKRMCKEDTGLFPSPKEISFTCSCPDWAHMCKHVAAVFYGVGARLDERPELLFTLRAVDEKDLIAKASKGLRARTAAKKPMRARVLDVEDLSDVFGIELVGVRKRARKTKPPGILGTSRLRRTKK